VICIFEILFRTILSYIEEAVKFSLGAVLIVKFMIIFAANDKNLGIKLKGE
jgi:hypothetical protein